MGGPELQGILSGGRVVGGHQAVTGQEVEESDAGQSARHRARKRRRSSNSRPSGLEPESGQERSPAHRHLRSRDIDEFVRVEERPAKRRHAVLGDQGGGGHLLTVGR